MEVFLCPQASRTSSCSCTALHCTDRDGGKLNTGQRWSGCRNSCGCRERDHGVVSDNCSEFLQAMVPVGH